MPYLNLDLDYFDHPKTVRLVALCGPEAEVCPIKLWAHAGKFFPEIGLLKGYSAAEVEAFAKWRGAPGALVAGLLKVGFMHETPDGFQMHEWLDHEGHLQAFKERARKASAARWDSIKDASSIPQASAKDSAKKSPIPTMPSVPSKPSLKEKTSAAPAAPQPVKPKKHEEPTAPFWKETVDFISESWKRKKGSAFYWRGQHFKNLKILIGLYQPWGVMALWETYLQLQDPWAKNAGYSFEMFESKIASLVDDPGWKGAARGHEDKLLGAMPPDISAVLNGAIKNQTAVKRS